MIHFPRLKLSVSGRKLNELGELQQKHSWSNSSHTAFNEKAKCFEKQYNKYKVRSKYKVNGKLTLGENIADNGGFKTSLKAYATWLKQGGRAEEKTLVGIDLNHEQLFHVSFAQSYCRNSRDKELYLSTLNDRHTDAEFRVIGTLSNSHEFAHAFKCPKGSPMNPAKKCRVWTDESHIDDLKYS